MSERLHHLLGAGGKTPGGDSGKMNGDRGRRDRDTKTHETRRSVGRGDACSSGPVFD